MGPPRHPSPRARHIDPAAVRMVRRTTRTPRSPSEARRRISACHRHAYSRTRTTHRHNLRARHCPATGRRHSRSFDQVHPTVATWQPLAAWWRHRVAPSAARASRSLHRERWRARQRRCPAYPRHSTVERVLYWRGKARQESRVHTRTDRGDPAMSDLSPDVRAIEMATLPKLARPMREDKCCHFDWCQERRGVVTENQAEGFHEIIDGMHPGCAPYRGRQPLMDRRRLGRVCDWFRGGSAESTRRGVFRNLSKDVGRTNRPSALGCRGENEDSRTACRQRTPCSTRNKRRRWTQNRRSAPSEARPSDGLSSCLCLLRLAKRSRHRRRQRRPRVKAGPMGKVVGASTAPLAGGGLGFRWLEAQETVGRGSRSARAWGWCG